MLLSILKGLHVSEVVLAVCEPVSHQHLVGGGRYLVLVKWKLYVYKDWAHKHVTYSLNLMGVETDPDETDELKCARGDGSPPSSVCRKMNVLESAQSRRSLESWTYAPHLRFKLKCLPVPMYFKGYDREVRRARAHIQYMRAHRALSSG